jgi:glyoxylase-like metal-dependent hydrolase (beta-lactamase superfamily II)
MSARTDTTSETGIAGLHATASHGLSFAPDTHVRAFLLERDRGNILIYSNEEIAGDLARFEALGGISRHYLNHWHESMFPSEGIEAPLFVHEAERARVERAYKVRGTFDRRHVLDEDFEVIPTPGHTPDATAYLWDSGERRMLFTGDSLYLHGGEWVAAVLDSSDRDAYVESLELMRDLEFDVLVPWAASADEPYVAEVEAAEARSRLDAVIERVRRGEDG